MASGGSEGVPPSGVPGEGAAAGDYDIVVVGSGIGGLTTAAALTTVGYKVLVLEAHEVAGGATHEYTVPSNTKFRFPSGLHSVIPHCQQLLQASCGAAAPPVVFARMGEPRAQGSTATAGGGRRRARFGFF